MEKQLTKMDKSRQSSCADTLDADTDTDSDEDQVPLVQVPNTQIKTVEAREKRALELGRKADGETVAEGVTTSTMEKERMAGH